MPSRLPEFCFLSSSFYFWAGGLGKGFVFSTSMIIVSKHKLWGSQFSLIMLITRWKEVVISLCFSSVKLLSKQEDHAKDEKILWELLKGKRKYQTPQSPLGPKELVFSEPNKKHHKSTTLMPSVSDKSITRSLSRGLGPHSPRLDPQITLGSSPSVAIPQGMSRKHIALWVHT